MDDLRLANAVCPGIVHPQVRYKELLRQLLQPGIRWLDLGCGHQVIRPWALLPGEDELSFTHASALSVGIDRDGSALRGNHCMPLRVAGDIQTLPFADRSFDLVTANMVLEHIEKPASLLAEVWRVLRPRGTFMFCTPNKYYPISLLASLLPGAIKSWLIARVTPRSERDVYPTFYRFNTQSVISRNSESLGFQMKYLETIESLSFNAHRALFLSHLALTWLLRRKGLERLQADFLAMLYKPDPMRLPGDEGERVAKGSLTHSNLGRVPD
jgi:ubiquinone/menaquinone biosynthesis C-methylase UbiE